MLAMHIRDGLLDDPAVVGLCWVIALAALAVSLRRLRHEVGDRLVPLVGVTSAAIFAAQMVNFPLLGLPASGHLMGGVLAAVLLGPWGAAVALTAVLVVQCLLFLDGGLVALGANLLNMAVLGGMVGYLAYATLRRAIGGRRGIVLGAAIASWLVLPLSAAAFSVQMAACGKGNFAHLLALMVGYHAVLGLVEAVIVAACVQWLLRVRPDLLYQPPASAGPFSTPRLAVAGLSVALAIAWLLAPWADSRPDAMEHVVEHRLAIAYQPAGFALAPFPDYALPAVAEDGQPGAWQRLAGAMTGTLGTLGTLATFAVALVLAGTTRLSARCNRSDHGR